MATPDTETDVLDIEQGAIPHACTCLAQMRTKAEELLAEWGGAAATYVAMTRPTRHLSLVHSVPLPRPLVGGGHG